MTFPASVTSSKGTRSVSIRPAPESRKLPLLIAGSVVAPPYFAAYNTPMMIEVRRDDDPQAVLDEAGPFLAHDPILNNLILTILSAEALHPQSAPYWIASKGGEIVGMAMQSRRDGAILLPAMPLEVAAAMGSAIGSHSDDPSGVSGEARLAARFAAEWAERRKSGAVPVAGRRIYEARAIREGPTGGGTTESATAAHHALVRDWTAAFNAEIGEPLNSTLELVTRRVSAREIWLWNDGGPRAIASLRPPVHATVRVSLVYTPPEHRRHGYAEALVRSLTSRLLAEGQRPMLYADLANPSSNGIYRRIGYEAAAEIVHYRFGTGGVPHPRPPAISVHVPPRR